ncbi:hypothetical protein AWC38_SpisGene19854 [Stylophora pistillata]|uniref:Uncharacterized protein n=1 Tax=Stylophora pistillata TaxID=50429 RepID=A0A2B4RHP4_STYPI|nr:hypothetical protein AWC38_SpisGene19854 [Stylophora pistillata]
MIDGVHSKNEEPKKNWVKNKNVKNLSLDLNSQVPVMQTPITVIHPSEYPNPDLTSEQPLRQLANLVDSIKPEYLQEGPQVQPQDPPVQVNVVEEGEISEAGNFQYGILEELLADVGVWYPCPIHNVGMNEVHSHKEWIQSVYLTCPIDNCPVFMDLKDFSTYNDQCRRQGHEWITLDKIAVMKCECDRQEGLEIAYAMGNATKLEEHAKEDIFEIAQLIGFSKFKKKASIKTQKADVRNYYALGKHRILRMVLFVDIFHQGKWLVPRTEMDLKFYLNPVVLYFNVEDNPGAEEVRQNADHIKLTFYVCLVSLNPSVYDNAMSIITKSPAKYPIIRTEMRQFPLDIGATSKEIMNRLTGKYPRESCWEF